MKLGTIRLAGGLTLPLVLGLTDGLLNALTLAASSMVGAGEPLHFGLALRVGIAALVTAAFTMAVADYAERRQRLARASVQLNLTSRGKLAATRLGRQVVIESAQSMLIAAIASFLGALLPLVAGTLLRTIPWIVVALTVASLAALGVAIARVVAGSTMRWSLSMGAAGIAVTYLGLWLHLA